MQKQEVHIYPHQSLKGSVTPPGAKSGTVRAILSATLAEGRSLIINGGTGDNIRAMMRACEIFGACISPVGENTWAVDGVGHHLPEMCELDAGNSGIVLRLLTAIGANMQHCVVGTSCPESLGRRGNAELIDALRQMEAKCYGQGEDARPPLVVGRGKGLTRGTIKVSGRRSSQFLSGLLFLSPLVGQDLEFVITDQLSARPMVQITLDVLSMAGITVQADPSFMRFCVPGGQYYRSTTFHIASDASSMGGLLVAIAAVPGSEVHVKGFTGDDAGTSAMIEALGQMGVEIERDASQLICRGAQKIQPIHLDGSKCPDSVLPLAALSCFAEGTSVFYNVETLRFKECDRISDFRQELLSAGADVAEERDTIIVHGHGGVRGGTTVNGRHDHSVVMAMAAVALRSERGLIIQGADAVAQTYRTFFHDLKLLGAHVENDQQEI